MGGGCADASCARGQTPIAFVLWQSQVTALEGRPFLKLRPGKLGCGI